MMNKPVKSLVPQRRFPEFQDARPWERKRLGEVATFSKGKGISKADISSNGSQPCIRYGQLYTHYQETIDDVVSYTNLPPKNLMLSQANDVVIPASGETQIDIATASCVMRKGIALGGDLNIIRSKMNGVFLSYYMNSAKKTAIAEMAQGISVVHLYPSQLTKLEIGIPKPPEQQKIADCLSSLDDLIRARAQKLEALKAHKKGLMQQLFPAQGQTTPQRRFPEFQDAGPWSISTIEKVGDVSSGGTPSRKNPEYWNGDIPWVTTTLIDSNTIDLANEYITELGLNNSSAKVFPKRTILMAMYGQGKTRGKVAMLGIDAAINQACAAITLKKGMNANFVFQNLGARYEEIRKISNQGGQENLSGAIIKQIPFPLPPKEDEQQKIAAFLTSADDLSAPKRKSSTRSRPIKKA